MNTNKLLLQIIFVCLAFTVVPEAASQQGCQTPEDIETLNKEVFDRRLAHINGQGAMMFIALDPHWSRPEFVTIPYRHPDDMTMIMQSYAQLISQGVDEVIVWQFGRRIGLGATVPFKGGCAINGYGEPDEAEKLSMMNKVYMQINKHGLDSPVVREGIKQLIMRELEPYQDESIYDDSMIEIMINKLRQLVMNMKTADGEN